MKMKEKPNRLPDEYIVECNKNEEYCNNVIEHYYVPRGRDRRIKVGEWEYIICRNDICAGPSGELSGCKIEHYVRPEYKDMPLFSYKEWKSLLTPIRSIQKICTKTRRIKN